MKYGESTFDILYLIFAVASGCLILWKASDRTEKLMGIAAIVLGAGDAFHLIPRVLNYFVEADLVKLIMIYPAVIFLLLCRHVRKYRQWCEDNFSTMDDIDVQWIVRYLTMLFIVGASFYFIVFW